MKWYLNAIRKYSDFNGRASRREYWLFGLFNLFFALFALYLDYAFKFNFDQIAYGPIYLFYALFTLVPGLALIVRRLHDIGKSGSFMFIAFIPIVGAVWLVILLLTKGDDEENNYGQNPKMVTPGNYAYNANDAELLLFLCVAWIAGTGILSVLFTVTDLYAFFPRFFGCYQDIKEIIWTIVPLGLAFTIKNEMRRNVLIIMGVLFFFGGYYFVLRSLEIF